MPTQVSSEDREAKTDILRDWPTQLTSFYFLSQIQRTLAKRLINPAPLRRAGYPRPD